MILAALLLAMILAPVAYASALLAIAALTLLDRLSRRK